MTTMHESIKVAFSLQQTLPNIGCSETATLEIDKLWSKLFLSTSGRGNYDLLTHT